MVHFVYSSHSISIKILYCKAKLCFPDLPQIYLLGHSSRHYQIFGMRKSRKLKVFHKISEPIDPAFGSKNEAADDHEKQTPHELVDILFEKLLSVVAPLPLDFDDAHTKQLLKRIDAQKLVIPLSYHVLSSNLILLNSRLSGAFTVFDNISKFFRWMNPFMTIGGLLGVTILILKPILFCIVPVMVLVTQFLVPLYLHIYPPDSHCVRNGLLEHNPIPASVPLEKYHIPTPVPQFSREFLVNMTDLQNHQLYYVAVWDAMIWLTRDYLYFKDENISTLLFIGAVFVTVLNLYLAPYWLAWLASHPNLVKALLLGIYWVMIIGIHPYFRSRILLWLCDDETRLQFQARTNRVEQSLESLLIIPNVEPNHDIRQVEIFEIQEMDPETRTWIPLGYSNIFYTHNSNLRRLHNQMKHEQSLPNGRPDLGCQASLELILPPIHWVYLDEKWVLDLDAQAWVNEYFVNDMVSIDDGEKWAYDIEISNTKIYRRRRWIRNVRRQTWEDRRKQS